MARLDETQNISLDQLTSRSGTAHRVLLIKPRIDDDEISVGIDFNYSRNEVLAAHQLYQDNVCCRV